jgi:arylsulfatase
MLLTEHARYCHAQKELSLTQPAQSAQTKPNILVIWGDDIGYWNISAYNQGMMGYRTPNIDRLATDGAFCTDA